MKSSLLLPQALSQALTAAASALEVMAGDDSEQQIEAAPSEVNDVNDPTDDAPDTAVTREKLNQALIQVRCMTA